jgi:DNA polymerase-1
VVQALLDYRKLKSKWNSVKTCLKKIHPETERVHAEYDTMGTATGRLSCKKPVVQGLPKDKEIHSCFVPVPGRKFVIADYSQIELRIAAAISQDQEMIKAFQSGQDFHRLTASIISDVPFGKVSKSQRKAAKAINFGILFGMGAEGLQEYAMGNYGHKMSIAEVE